MATATQEGKQARALLKQLREFLDGKVAPIINKYWAEDSFSFELLPAFNVHNGLAMGSIYETGSEEQKQKWLPPMACFAKA